MRKENSVPETARVVAIRIKSIKRIGKADVYCLSGLRNGTMIANGIITRNCDALRYAIASHKVSVYNPYNDAKHNDEWKSRYEPTRRF